MDYIRLFPENPNPKEIERVVATLRQGGIIIYPTDTLYALGCDALNVRAVERICKLKNIDPRKALLSIVCPDLSMLSQYAKVSNICFKLMRRNLPGAFTFILPTSSQLPHLYKSRKTVGIRVPDNAIARAIAQQLGNPLLSSSVASVHSEIEYLTDPELMREEFEHRVDLMVDGGIGGFTPSTIVDCSGETPEITREGKGELLC